MTRGMVFGFLILIVSIPFPLVGQQYQESRVLNAACANVQIPSTTAPFQPYPFLLEAGLVTFKLKYEANPANRLQGQYVPVCEVGVPIYSSTVVNSMIDDLRDQVLKAIKTGIVQAAIKGDQVETLSTAIQRTVENELRAGALREVTELRQELAALAKRLEELEAKQPVVGAGQ